MMDQENQFLAKDRGDFMLLGSDNLGSISLPL